MLGVLQGYHTQEWRVHWKRKRKKIWKTSLYRGLTGLSGFRPDQATPTGLCPDVTTAFKIRSLKHTPTYATGPNGVKELPKIQSSCTTPGLAAGLQLSSQSLLNCKTSLLFAQEVCGPTTGCAFGYLEGTAGHVARMQTWVSITQGLNLYLITGSRKGAAES